MTWRELDGEVLVRDPRTGSTHLLEPVAGEVLRALVESESGMTVPELVSRLRDEAAPDEQWTNAIEAVLSDFKRLGLAERRDA